ncbi:MAG: isopentenyl phosphate kinase [Anaerolineae bacterium]
MEELVFVKLGGSLITDKRRRATARHDIIHRLARETQEALSSGTDLRILLGHGSGSFGHWEANRYRTHEGVHTQEGWYGFARVSATALQLDRIVLEAFIEAGIPALSLQPLASALTEGGNLVSLNLDPIRRALTHGLVPLIFGDVAFDKAVGGTIISTEDIFVYLAQALNPARILLLGNAPGVLSNRHKVIPEITPETLPEIAVHLRGSGYTDVTGGMADKVERMVHLVTEQPELQVWIMTGAQPGNLRRALLEPAAYRGGTLIHASTPGP